MTNQKTAKKYQASYSYLENGEKNFFRINAIVVNSGDLDFESFFKKCIEKDTKTNHESISILGIREINLNPSEDPTLYVSYEDDKSIIARTEYDIRHVIPGRRYHKYKDASGKYVIIEHIRIKKVLKIKSTEASWVYEF